MKFWLSNPDEPIHELYTTASGLYVTWLSVRLLILFCTWAPRGWTAVWEMIRRWSVTVN